MKFLLSISSLLALLISVMSCLPRRSQESIVHIPLETNITSFDTAVSFDSVTANVLHQVHEQLFEYHYLKRPYTLQPLLAKDMPTISNNGKTYTIQIRQGIRYHDHYLFKGEPRYLIADDFITQFKRLAFISTQSSGWWLFDGKIVGLNEFRDEVGTDFSKFFTTEVKGLEAPNDHTLVIHLTNPYPQLLYALAMSFSSPTPKEFVTYYQNILDEVLIGTGPFYLTHIENGKQITLSRFAKYHEQFYPQEGDRLANSRGLLRDAGRKLPLSDKLIFHISHEAKSRWEMFLTKKIDFLSLPKDAQDLIMDPVGRLTPEMRRRNLQLQAVPSLTFWWLSFNMNHPLWGQNWYLRKAIAHAINPYEYIEIFTGNSGQRANSIYPPGIPGYDPASELPYNFDLEKARYYLEKAGHPNGEGLPKITYTVRGLSQNNIQQAEYIRDSLARIGIQVEPSVNPFPVFLEKSRQGRLEFWLDGWIMDYPDAENILQKLLSQNHTPGPNESFYVNREIDRLYDSIKHMPMGPQKEAVLQEIDRIVHRDLPWIMLYYTRHYFVHHDHLQNFRHSDIIYNYGKYLRSTRR